MKAQGVRLIAAAFVAAGIAGCFSDPTSSLRNGPAKLVLTHTAAVIASGDSTLVEARLEDEAGNLLPITGATWASDNASVADVHLSATQAPEDASSRAYIIAMDTTGGVTYARISARGLTDSVRVNIEPAHKVFPVGVLSVVGDTVILTASADLAFDPAASQVHIDSPAVRDSPSVTTYLLSRSASQIRVLYREPVTNFRVWVTHVLLSGGNPNSAVPLDSFNTSESISVARATLPALSVSQAASAVFGANTILKITPPTGWKLDPANAAVMLGTEPAKVLSRTADSMLVLSTNTGGYVNGTVQALNLVVTAGGPVDSLRTTGNYTVAQARLPDASLTVSTSATYGTNTRLTIKPPSGTTFNPFTSAVRFTAASGRILFRSADSIAVIATATGGYTGTISVSNVISSAAGGGTIDSLRNTTGVTVAQAAFPDADVTVRTGPLGANTEVKVVPPAGTVFTAASNVVFGASNGTALFRSADSIVAITSSAYNGTIKVTNLLSTETGGAAIDSLRNTTPQAVAAAPFPGTFVQKGAGGLLDTVLVIGGALADFTLNASCGEVAVAACNSASNVTINGGRAFVLRRAADTLYLLTNLSGTSVLTVSNVIVSGVTIPTLNTAGTITISQASAETDEPANNAPGGVTFTPGTPASPYVHYGTVDGDGSGLGTDADDFRAFTLAASRTVNIQLQFGGTGAGGAVNPDIDLLVCNATCSSFPFGFNGATGSQPENHNITNMPAGTYNIYVNGWDSATKTVGYKLVVY